MPNGRTLQEIYADQDALARDFIMDPTKSEEENLDEYARQLKPLEDEAREWYIHNPTY